MMKLADPRAAYVPALFPALDLSYLTLYSQSEGAGSYVPGPGKLPLKDYHVPSTIHFQLICFTHFSWPVADLFFIDF